MTKWVLSCSHFVLHVIIFATVLAADLNLVYGSDDLSQIKILKAVGTVKLNGRRAQEKTLLTVGDSLEVAKGSSYADLTFKESYFRLIGGKFTIEKNMQKKQGKRVKFRLEEGDLYFWFKQPAKLTEENIRLSSGKVELIFLGAKVKKESAKPGKEASGSSKPSEESQFLFSNDNKVIDLHVHKGSVLLQKKIKKTDQVTVPAGNWVSLSRENPDIKLKPNEERHQLRLNRIFEEFNQTALAMPKK
jgi:hypothetical protein